MTSPAPEFQLHALLADQNKITLGTAESITGGAVAARIARPAGASAYLNGGIVSYAYDVKQNLLGVPRDVLDNPGAVSDECARRMAMGAARALGCTIAVSTTGIAGPSGATKRKPVGLVYIAVAGPHGTTCEEYMFEGDRDAITAASTDRAMEVLLAYVQRVLDNDRSIDKRTNVN